MDVKVMAFELTTGNGISISNFYDYCLNTAGMLIYNRIVYVDKKDEWLRGLILTSKNIKAFSKLIREQGKVILSPQSIDNGELAHFNFFLINMNNLHGYFQYYHGSTSIHSFGDTLKRKYRDLREFSMAKECKDNGVEANYIPRYIKNKYNGYLKFDIVFRKKTFQEFMEGLNYVKNLTVQFKEYIPDQPLFRPLAEKAKSRRHSLTFKTYEHRAEILRDIIALGNADVIKDLHGVGVAGDNYERAFKLLNEPETLDRFDFNNVVLETEFDSSNVTESIENAPIVRRLYEIAEKDQWIHG
jgi:hypothetical protein